MTGKTADRYRISGRGYIKPGFKADLTVIDLEKISVNEQKSDERPKGIDSVYINGRSVMENGVYLGGCAGKILLKERNRAAENQ